MALTCPDCGNETNFQVKTLQLHLMQYEEDGPDLNREGGPLLLELLCDECETPIEFSGSEDREIVGRLREY